MRYKLQNIITEENDITIYNPLSIDWSTFEWNNGYKSHKLTQDEILKTWMISYKYYRTVIYEDIILLLNKIADIHEVPVGTEILIPDLAELKSFIIKNKKNV